MNLASKHPVFLEKPAEFDWPTFLAARLRKSMRRHGRLRRDCAKNVTNGSLHQLRIETRRQLALVVLAGAVCGVAIDSVRRSLKPYLRATGKLRDAQVQIELVNELIVAHPELRKFRKRLGRDVNRRHRETERKLRRASKKRPKGIRSLLRKVSETEDFRVAGAAIERALRTAYQEAFDLGVNAPMGGEPLHRARVALKSFRYMIEALRGAVPAVIAAWSEELHRQQRLMGTFHDLELLAARLDNYVMRHPNEYLRLRHVHMTINARKNHLWGENQLGFPVAPRAVPGSVEDHNSRQRRAEHRLITRT